MQTCPPSTPEVQAHAQAGLCVISASLIYPGGRGLRDSGLRQPDHHELPASQYYLVSCQVASQHLSPTPAKPAKPERPEEPAKPEKPARPERPERPSRPTKPSKPAKPEEPGKPAKPERPARPERPAKRCSTSLCLHSELTTSL